MPAVSINHRQKFSRDSCSISRPPWRGLSRYVGFGCLIKRKVSPFHIQCNRMFNNLTKIYRKSVNLCFVDDVLLQVVTVVTWSSSHRSSLVSFGGPVVGVHVHAPNGCWF